jgi:phage host-nuclease inhibitor protein Gam
VKTCKYGHEMTHENTAKNGMCKMCFVSYRKAYREANKEKIAECDKAYREANKEKIAECDKAYREANKEKIAERYKAYCEANKEKIAERGKAYREANREILAARRKEYNKANKEKIDAENKARCENLTDSYVASRIGISVENISKEIIDLKRLLITIKRELRNGKQHSNKYGE